MKIRIIITNYCIIFFYYNKIKWKPKGIIIKKIRKKFNRIISNKNLVIKNNINKGIYKIIYYFKIK